MVRAGYKQTEVGEIPEDWDVSKMGDFDPFVTSGSRGWAAYYAELGDPFIRITNLTRKKVYLELDDLRFVKLHPSSSEGKRTALRNQDILISITADIGICSFVTDSLDKPAYINQHISLVRFDDERIDPKFVTYFLASDPVQRIFVANSDTGAKAGMNLEGIRSIRFARPKAKEQKAIAAALSDVDGLIGALEKQITKKQNIKTATMQQLLTGKKRLPGYGEGKGYKQTELGPIPENWKKINIGQDASLNARIGWQALTTKEYEKSGKYFLVTGTDFIGGRVNWDTCHYISKWRFDQDRKIQLKNDDVLITKDGTIGKAGYVENLKLPSTLNSGVFVIRPVDGKFFPLFLYYILTSRIFDEFLSRITAGSTITHLYQKDFVHFDFYAPEPDEQQEVANVLGAMDKELGVLEAKLSKAKAIKQGMVQELLTGRTRLV